jgi:hypothetical protein
MEEEMETDIISKSKNCSDLKWRLLGKRKKEFIDMLSILNRYYRLRSDGEVSESQKFRDEVLSKKKSEFRVFLKRFGEYEFLIYLEIKDKKSKRGDSWIHIDGIKQERDFLIAKGNCDSNHPVFNIICLSDLYESNSTIELKDYTIAE